MRPIIDGQLHEFGPRSGEPPESLAEAHSLMLELTELAMDSLGVAGAVLHPLDNSWADHAIATRPDRFVQIPMLPADDQGAVAGLLDRTGVVAGRIIVSMPATAASQLDEGVWDETIKACQQRDLPVLVSLVDAHDTLGRLAARFPEVHFVCEMLGVAQPPMMERGASLAESVGALKALAQHENVSGKVAGVQLYSAGWPFEDLWPTMHEIIDAFTPDRLFWASDASRLDGRMGYLIRMTREQAQYPGRYTYADALSFIRDTSELSTDAKEALLGGTVRRLLRLPESFATA